MLTALVAVLLFGGVLALGIFMFRFQVDRGEQLLDAWAAQQGYRVLSREAANPPGTGPMHRAASNKQVMYRVRVVDGAGRTRSGTVRVGTPTVGVLSDQVTVDWDADDAGATGAMAPGRDGALAEGAPDDTQRDFGVPLYPGAVRDAGPTQRLNLGGYYQLQAAFTSIDSPERVTAFYRAHFAAMPAQRGEWAESGDAQKRTFVLKRDALHVTTLAIEPASDSSGSELQLSATGSAEAGAP